MTGIHNHSGSKYLRKIHPADKNGSPILVDVYEVLRAFDVTCPATQHAIKKLLCAGLRNKASQKQDLSEAIESIHRAIEMAEEAVPVPVEVIHVKKWTEDVNIPTIGISALKLTADQGLNYARALRKIARLKEVSHTITNDTVFDMLCAHFIQGHSVQAIAEYYGMDITKQDRTYISKILSKNFDGKEASRRHDVKRIFAEFVQECGIQCLVPFKFPKSLSTQNESPTTSQSEKKPGKHSSTLKPSLGLIKKPTSGKSS
jgi:hypothetical protein